jgi:hypothetical protein
MRWCKFNKSCYEGSMIGAGVEVFALWPYVISHAEDGRVKLNPKLISLQLGCEVGAVDVAIEYLMNPDPESQFKEYEGRRLIKEEESFTYFIPSWEKYNKVQSPDAYREQNRIRQQAFRDRQKVKDSKKK